MSVTRVSNFVAAKGKEKALFDLLTSIMPYIENSVGCESAKLMSAIDDENLFMVIEEWQTIEHHKQSVENFPKEAMQAAMPLFAKPPQGNYFK